MWKKFPKFLPPTSSTKLWFGELFEEEGVLFEHRLWPRCCHEERAVLSDPVRARALRWNPLSGRVYTSTGLSHSTYVKVDQVVDRGTKHGSDATTPQFDRDFPNWKSEIWQIVKHGDDLEKPNPKNLDELKIYIFLNRNVLTSEMRSYLVCSIPKTSRSYSKWRSTKGDIFMHVLYLY